MSTISTEAQKAIQPLFFWNFMSACAFTPSGFKVVILVSGTQGSTIGLQASDGTVAFAFTIPQSSSTLVLSSPDIETGTEYTVYTGETASGDEFYGLYLGDLSYSQGTAGSSFTVSSSVTNVGGTQMEGPGGPGTRPGM
jgi:hypothetical protein